MKQLTCLILLTLVAACAKYEAAPITEVTDISVSFDGSVEWRQVTTSDSNGVATNEAFINDLPYSLEDGTLQIGEQSFTGLVAGDKVHVSTAGITVNGEHRWDLPK